MFCGITGILIPIAILIGSDFKMICSTKMGRFICTALYFFFSGVEYVVILPTLNGYLNLLDAPSGFIGIVMASFSFAGLVTTPIYGLLSDKTKSSKFALVISNIFEITGNCLYFVGKNFYVVLVSRIVAGIGSGSASAVIGMVARTTSSTERTSVLSVLLSTRQLGLVIGPAANIFFDQLSLSLGPFVLSEFTAPGLFMGVVWLLHTVLVMFLYYDEVEVDEITDALSSSHQPGLSPFSLRQLYDEFVREEVVMCILITFFIMFVQLGIESALTPFTLIAFGWGGLYNSYLYCGAGISIILSFIALTVCSKSYNDRDLIVFGIVTVLLGLFLFLAFSISLYFSKYSVDCSHWLFWIFLLDVGLITIGLPFAWVPTTSLYSKITTMESQGFNQGVRLAALGVGQILGPLWAAPMVTFGRLPYLAGVNVLLMILLLAMFIASYSKMKGPPNEILESTSPPDDRYCEEGTPLLREK